MSQRNKILEIAAAQIGVSAPSGDDKYIQWYNEKTGAGFSMNVPWCAIFVSWCAAQAGVELYPLTASCTQGMNWFKARGQWKERGGYIPQPGDFIYFDWDGSGDADHIGIVEDAYDGQVYTIEGNSADAVRRRIYSLNDLRIRGYGIPGYADDDEKLYKLIATVKPSKIQIYLNPDMKSPQKVIQETGCDYVAVSGLFHLNSWLLEKKFIPYCHLKVDGKVLASDQYTYWGYAWNDASDFGMTVVPCDKMNYICCCVLIDPNGPVAKPIYGAELGGSRGRAGIGTMPNGDIVLFGSLDEGKGKLTVEELRDEMVAFGAKNFVMLDCGGSSVLLTKDKSIYNGRPLPYYILIWGEQKAPEPTPEPTPAIITDEQKNQIIREWLAEQLEGLK